MTTAILAISGISIKQDSHGRFCLNDLHKAAGGERRHELANWTALQQTKDLIAELLAEKSTTGIPVVEQNQPLDVVNGGKFRGTYAVKELVYAYATWISARFFLTVIRAYDAIVSKPAYALRELPPSMLTTEMKNHVQEMVNALKHQTGKAHNTIYHDLKTEFKASSYKEIPIVKYADVCAYFGKKPIHEMPDLIQCDSRYLAELEQKAVALPVQQIQTVTIPMSEYLAFKNDFKMTSSDWIYMLEQQGGRIISKEQVEKINSLVGMFEA